MCTRVKVCIHLPCSWKQQVHPKKDVIFYLIKRPLIYTENNLNYYNFARTLITSTAKMEALYFSEPDTVGQVHQVKTPNSRTDTNIKQYCKKK